MLAPHGLPLQLTPTKDGCQLSLHHATGVILENFTTVSSALRRVAPDAPPVDASAIGAVNGRNARRPNGR